MRGAMQRAFSLAAMRAHQGNRVDSQLALAYLGGMEANDAFIHIRCGVAAVEDGAHLHGVQRVADAPTGRHRSQQSVSGGCVECRDAGQGSGGELRAGTSCARSKNFSSEQCLEHGVDQDRGIRRSTEPLKVNLRSSGTLGTMLR